LRFFTLYQRIGFRLANHSIALCVSFAGNIAAMITIRAARNDFHAPGFLRNPFLKSSI